MSIIQTFPLTEDPDLSSYMQKGIDYVTAGKATGSTLGSNATAEGKDVVAFVNNAHAEGFRTTAKGFQSHAEGYMTCAYGTESHAEGLKTSADDDAHAEGSLSFAYGSGSHAEGLGAYAVGAGAHAEGWSSTAYSGQSHTEGYKTSAYGQVAHAEGYMTCAIGDDSHSEGYRTCAVGNYSHAEGNYTTAKSIASHAGGEGTVASGYNQTVIGKYNKIDNDDGSAKYAFIIGNGVDNSNRDNLLTVGWDGKVEINYNEIKGAAFKDTTDSYSSTGTNPITGKGVAAAINGLDASEVGGSGKYITTISETDGVISASADTADTTVTQNSSKLVTSGAVWTAIGNLPKPMVLRGTIGAAGDNPDITTLPVDGTANEGDTYKVISNGTYAGVTAKIGDLFSCKSKTSSTNTWTYIPSGDDSIVIANPSGTPANHLSSISIDGNLYDINAINDIDGNAIKTTYMKKDTDRVTAGKLSGTTLGTGATAEGSMVTASGNYSHAEGNGTYAIGNYTHAEGISTSATQLGAHAEGNANIASGLESHAEGGLTVASGEASHAEGFSTIASGKYSHVAGYGTCATGDSQTVVGKYNVADAAGANGQYAFIVGGGTASNARKNLFAVKWDGTIEYSKPVAEAAVNPSASEISSYPDGAIWLVTE